MRHVTGDQIESPTAAQPADIVRASVDIAAPVADVFRALVDPRELAAWLGGEPMPSDPRVERSVDPSRPPVGEWRAPAIAPDGTIGVVTGEYGYCAPPHFLETTWRASWNRAATDRVRFQLVPIDVGGVAGTRVIVTHTRARSPLRVTTAMSHTDLPAPAWDSWLAQLSAHVVTVAALGRSSSRDGASFDSFDALHRAVVELHHAS